MLLFSGQSRLLSERSLPATTANIRSALALVDDENGGGGTELEAALARVLSLPRKLHTSRSVVLITDGYIAQERGEFELIEKNLDTLGQAPPGAALMRALAALITLAGGSGSSSPTAAPGPTSWLGCWLPAPSSRSSQG